MKTLIFSSVGAIALAAFSSTAAFAVPITVIDWQNSTVFNNLTPVSRNTTIPTGSTVSQNGITTTITYTGSFSQTTPRVINTHVDRLFNLTTPADALRLSQNAGPSGSNLGVNSFVEITFSFSQALNDIVLEIYDVDTNDNNITPGATSGFVDIVNVFGFLDAGTVTPTASLKTIVPDVSPILNGTEATGQTRIFDNPNDIGGGTLGNPFTTDATTATVVYRFFNPINSLRVRYEVGNPDIALANQTIGIGNIEQVPFEFNPAIGLGVVAAAFGVKKLIKRKK